MYEEAKLDYEKILNDFPRQENLHILYNNRASLYIETNELEKALKDVNKSIKLKRKYSMGILNRGNIYLKLRNTKKACKDFKKAIKLGVLKGDHFKADEDFEKLKTNCEK